MSLDDKIINYIKDGIKHVGKKALPYVLVGSVLAAPGCSAMSKIMPGCSTTRNPKVVGYDKKTNVAIVDIVEEKEFLWIEYPTWGKIWDYTWKGAIAGSFFGTCAWGANKGYKPYPKAERETFGGGPRQGGQGGQ